MKLHLTGFVFLTTVIFLVTTAVHAVELNISGNGTGSQNSVTIQSNTQNTVNQQNQIDINNDINAEANTGGNNTNNGSVQTGDASIFVKIKNLFNTNSADVDCCPPGTTTTPTPTPTPTVYDPNDPTSASAVGGPGGETGSGGSTAANGTILGLSATAGEGKDALWFYVAGILSIATGTALTRKSHI